MRRKLGGGNIWGLHLGALRGDAAEEESSEGTVNKERSFRGAPAEEIFGGASEEETCQSAKDDSDGNLSIQVDHVVVSDCTTGTCNHSVGHKIVGCECCGSWFHWYCVDLSKEEELLLLLEESVFVCIGCGDVSVYIRVLCYFQLLL